MPAGRPTKYKPEYCQKVEDLMYEGASIEEVAWTLRISKQTLYDWKEAHPEFLDAIKTGVENSKGWWKFQGRSNLKDKDFSSTLWYMNMKNRFGWADKQDLTSKGEKIEGIVYLPAKDECG